MSSAIQALPSLGAIQDPAVKAYLQVLADGWNVRNGAAGDGNHRFLTMADLAALPSGVTQQWVKREAAGQVTQAVSALAAKVQVVANASYTSANLMEDLSTGVRNVLAGTGGNYHLNIDSINSIITLAHKDSAYPGPAAAGLGVRPALAVTAAGIAMGYNDNAGTWHTGVSINSTGVATFAGTVNANAGNFVGGVTIGTGGSISSGQSAYNTGIGYWLEANGGTPRMSIGNPAGNSLTWDGSNLNLNGVSINSTSTLNSLALSSYLNSNITLGTLGAGAFATLGSLTSANIASYVAAGAIGSTYIASVSASTILAGTLAAGVIYSGSITAGQISAGSLSAISANLGTVTSGNIDSTGYVHATSYGGYNGCISGVSATFTGVYGETSGSFGAYGVYGISKTIGGIGVFAQNSFGGSGLYVIGTASLTGAVTIGGAVNAAGQTITATTFSGALSGNATTATSTQTVYASNGTDFIQLATTPIGVGGGTATFVATNKPGASNSNTWLKQWVNGVQYVWPAWLV